MSQPTTQTCPDPAAHEPDCVDTRYDYRGDCDGRVYPYVATGYVLGYRPGEVVWLCSSHGRQAGRKGEVNRAQAEAVR